MALTTLPDVGLYEIKIKHVFFHTDIDLSQSTLLTIVIDSKAEFSQELTTCCGLKLVDAILPPAAPPTPTPTTALPLKHMPVWAIVVIAIATALVVGVIALLAYKCYKGYSGLTLQILESYVCLNGIYIYRHILHIEMKRLGGLPPITPPPPRLPRPWGYIRPVINTFPWFLSRHKTVPAGMNPVESVLMGDKQVTSTPVWLVYGRGAQWPHPTILATLNHPPGNSVSYILYRGLHRLGTHHGQERIDLDLVYTCIMF